SEIVPTHDASRPMPHFYGAVSAPNVGHHQLPPFRRRRRRGSDVYYSRATRLFLRDLRRGDPAPDYGRRITAVVLTILVHLAALFLLALSRPPGYPPPAGEPDTQNIDVRIITQTKPPPPPPPIELPKRKQPVQKKAAQPVPPTVKRAPVAAM